ncbi:MAG: 6,7-dimethyl-8-ribityllumazine synthase [Elusimicrobia bacterium RIFOXYD12_FULL_66_9]|nr:MAG: 6,7-dimethyl-8-ribityllumazine synthase [Elusimicrobia bacterium RIFOXYD12_FULL_66_9]
MKKIAVVVSRFNEEVTSRLLANCLKTFKSEGWTESRLKVVHVPGGYEIAWAVAELARTGKYAAVVTLGCVLKGQTPQNDHIASSLVASLHRISLDTRVPVILGVLTPNTWKQAMARTKGSLDRGQEAALAALEMVALAAEIHHGTA